MVAKKLSIYSILTSICKIYLVMPAPPQFPDVRVGHMVPSELVDSDIVVVVNARVARNGKICARVGRVVCVEWARERTRGS